MRRVRAPHGTLCFAPTFRGGGSVSSSARVIAGCSEGSSRKYRYQIATQTKLTAPRITKLVRQPKW